MLKVLPLLLMGLVLAGCGSATTTNEQFSLIVRAVEPDGTPVADAEVFVNDSPIGKANAKGELHFELAGEEGVRVKLGVECPVVYQQQRLEQTVAMRHIRDLKHETESKAIEHAFVCTPLINRTVVVVRSNAPANLPVLLDGKEVARTNEFGIAHLFVEMAPNAEFQVKISTLSDEQLRPQEPSHVFRMPEGREVLLFEQNFEVEKEKSKKRKRRAPRRKARKKPVRLN